MKKLPFIVTAACLLAIAAGLAIPPTEYSERTITVLFSIIAAAYVVVGALLSSRRSDNLVGWLMLGIGALLSLPVLLGPYAGFVLLEQPTLPGGLAAAWVTTWIYIAALCGVVALVLRFPNGRITESGRAWTSRISVVAGVVATTGSALLPGPMDGFGPVSNPVGVAPLGGLLDVLVPVAGLVVVTTFVVALVSIFLRLRRAGGMERLQLKWFAYASVVMLVCAFLNAPLGLGETFVGLLLVVVALTAHPVAVAVAILRHRLYDIDVVIKRTLVYGSLTVLLVATYLVLVLGLRVLLGPLVGESDLAVAVSTLAVAALFRPARSRIQAVVDRRFYRRRYDAARTVASFSGRLRQDVDLDSISSDLRDVVRDTVAPTQVSLWLRRPA